MHDIFISHAGEDKERIARPLADQLRSAGLNVWYDEFSLRLGDSLRESIDRGLAESRYGLVILSHNFFAKRWPQAELNGLFAMETAGTEKRILPVWHDITQAEVARHSPILADRVAVSTTTGLDVVLERVLDTIEPDSRHKVSSGRMVAINPTSVRLHEGEWAVKTQIIVTNPGDIPVYTVAVKILIQTDSVTSSSLEIETAPQIPPVEETIGNVIVSADHLRLNCSTKDGKQVVLLILHTIHAKAVRSFSIKGTIPISSSADISIEDIHDKPGELLTRRGKEWAVMFKPTENLILSSITVNTRPKV